MLDLSFVAAPMINQSDFPFRVLVRRYGATLAYTQMLNPDKLLNDREFLEFHQRGMLMERSSGSEGPVVVQLCGNEPDTIVKAGRKLQGYSDGIGANHSVTRNHICG